jgi:hypothetical protein
LWPGELVNRTRQSYLQPVHASEEHMRKIIRTALSATALAAVGLIASLTPALAQNPFHNSPFHTSPFHAIVVPTTCVDGDCNDAAGSARFVNDPNHFHLVLDLSATGCEEINPDAVTVQQVPFTRVGGVIKNFGAHPVDNFSFDFKVDYCSGEVTGDDFFFVEAVDTNNNFYDKICGHFPTPGSSGTWIHELFNRSFLGIPSGAKISYIYVGIFNSTTDTNNAEVKNFAVNGIPCVDEMIPSANFCPPLFLVD